MAFTQAHGFDTTARIEAAKKVLRFGGGQSDSIHSKFFTFR